MTIDAQDLLDALEEKPMTASALAIELGLSARAVSTKLTWMRGEGLVESVRTARAGSPNLWRIR